MTDVNNSSESTAKSRGVFKPVEIIFATSLNFKQNFVSFFKHITSTPYIDKIFAYWDMEKLAVKTVTITYEMHISWFSTTYSIGITSTLV